MKYLSIGFAAAMAGLGQGCMQVPQQAPLAVGAAYPFNAPTPEDAYRQGLINRWELEQLVGPLPQALKGPPVNGDRGGDDGGGRN